MLSDPASAINQMTIRPLNAKSLANLILDWADKDGVSVTPMKLQKLVYFCHADFLIDVGQPLIEQEFEAWEYGPVIPSLFHEFKDFGSQSITRRATCFNPITCQSGICETPSLGAFEESIRASYEAYARYTASSLSKLSHSEAGPWAEALRRFERGSIKGRTIDNRLIAECHKHPGSTSVH